MSLVGGLATIFFAGLWAEVWRYGVGIGIIVLLLAAAWFSPIFKREFAYGAAVVAAFMVAFTIGVRTGEHRVKAQWDAANLVEIDRGNAARDKAVARVARKPIAGGMRAPIDEWDRSRDK